MKILTKTILAAGIAAIGFTACSDDDTSLVKVEGPDGVYLFDLDSLAIPDSILESDSLFTWYLDQLIKEKTEDKSSASKDSDSKDDSKSSASKGDSKSSASKGDGKDPASSGSKDPDKVMEEDLEADIKVDLTPQMLTPAGFFRDSVVLPVPGPTVEGGKIHCVIGGADAYMVSAETFEFTEPITIKKNTTVSCAEWDKGESEVLRRSTHTYFINESVSMPVVAISVEPSFFTRVYKDSKRCEGDDPFLCPGLMDDTEDFIHMEFFEKGSSTQMVTWEVEGVISLMGNYSRTYPKKPVAIKMKKQYQEKKLKYNMFAARPEKNKFRGFNLRNSGNRYVGDYIGDPAMTAIVEGSSVDYQRSRQVVVFYNGQYYGIHDLRERINEHFVETNYGIDNNTVDVVRQRKDSLSAAGGTIDAYKSMLNFIATNDFSGANNKAYEEVKTMMDVGNYADYIAAQFYLKNADWPSNNVRVWRSPEQPFKFILFDVDQSLGWDWVSSDFKDNTGGMFAWMRNPRSSITSPDRTGPGYFANIYIQLSKNPDFRRMFANHGAVMMNDFLTYDRLKASVDTQNDMIPYVEMVRDQKAFYRPYSPYGGGEGHFDLWGDHILEGAVGRTEALREEYRKEFGLGEDITVTVGANGNGSVTIDGMKLPRVNYTGTFFGGNDMLLEAVSNGGVFTGWSDGVTDNPRLVSPADGDKFIAEFK